MNRGKLPQEKRESKGNRRRIRSEELVKIESAGDEI